MCGISGVYLNSPTKSAEELRVIGKRMSDSISHRGPDSSGIFVDQNNGVSLSHRRLSILDLTESGAQPMTSPSDRYVVVFNGEIYNYLSLKKRAGINDNLLSGHSDTEVLVHLFDLWGLEKTVVNLNGMFAIAIWDKHERSLYLVRDRIGIKPLYYGRYADGWAFCSELKGIEKLDNFTRKINTAGLNSVLHWGYVREEQSIYEGITRCRPGTIVQIKNTCFQPIETEFWSALSIAEKASKNPFHGDYSEAVDELERLIKRAVSRQLIADVPVGAFLSGGVDSSVVAAIMSQVHDEQVNTFTIGFEDQKYNEAHFAAETAKLLGTHHTERYTTADKALEIIPKIPSIFDEPFADSSQIPTYIVSQLAKEQVQVVLSGDGGDELFFGYPKYKKVRKLNQLLKLVPKGLFGILTNNASRYLSTIPEVGPKSKIFALHQMTDRLSAYEALICQWSPFRYINSIDKNSDIRNRLNQLEIYTLMSIRDIQTYLPDDILTKVDRASMAVSLEARVPLLDHDIIEFSATLPPEFKTDASTSKRVLKSVLDRYLPAEMINRPKKGFAVPLAQWLRHELRDWAEPLLDKKSLEEVFGDLAPYVSALWQEHVHGHANRAPYLWNILSIQSWIKTHRAHR